MEKTNANVQTTSVTQSANELMGTKEKTLYFLVVETPIGKYTMNVGQKSHDEVKRLTTPRDEKTVIQIDKGGKAVDLSQIK